MATPTLKALRQGLPSAQIDWIVHPFAMMVVEAQPEVSRKHVLPRKNMWRAIWRVGRELRRAKYDIVIDQQGLLKSGVMTALTRCKRRYGPAEAREGATRFYTNLLPAAPEEHVIRHYLLRAREIGATWDVEDEPPMVFPAREEDQRFVEGWLGERGLSPGRLVAVNPAAGQEIKQWPAERFGRLAATLHQAGWTPIITGAPQDRALGDAVQAASGGVCVDAVGATSLRQLPALLGQCELFVGGDTGPMHIAQAAGTRVLALFGPTNAARLGPRAPQHRTIYRPGPMAAISESEVTEVVREMLELSRSSPRA